MQTKKRDNPSAFVFVMWILTFLAWFMVLAGGAGGAILGLLLDLTALVIAVVFLNGTNEANRKAARAKLWLELTIFIIGMILSHHEAQNGQSRTGTALREQAAGGMDGQQTLPEGAGSFLRPATFARLLCLSH